VVARSSVIRASKTSAIAAINFVSAHGRGCGKSKNLLLTLTTDKTSEIPSNCGAARIVITGGITAGIIWTIPTETERFRRHVTAGDTLKMILQRWTRQNLFFM
jgi:hypothetical protein